MIWRPHKWKDVAWKRAIADGARDAIAYFMPDLASDMDTSREITGITGMELLVKDSDSDKGMRVSDVFLNVPVRGGEDWSVACLAEQQDEDKKDLAACMFDSFVRLRAQRPAGRTTGFVIYTGHSRNINSYTELCYGLEATIKFRTFHVLSYELEELRKDYRPFARVMYAGRLSFESGDDLALREKYAWELLNTPSEEGYDKRQKKYILEFTGRIFRLNDPRISEDLREAYKVQTISLEQYVAEIDKAEAKMEGKEEKAFEDARNFFKMGLPLVQIAQGTGLSIEEVNDLR
jgi:hypothetical protein